LLALAVACTPHGRRSDDAIEVVVSQDADTIDPRFVVDAIGMRVSRLVHAGLFRLDPDTLEPIPYLAEAYRFSEDGRTLDVTLREGVRFHSGAAFGARDVVATLEALRDPALGARASHVVSAIDRVVAVDDRHVRIHLGRAHATLLTDLEVPVLRADQARWPPDAAMALDGLGPYRVAHHEPGSIELEPADHAALPRPAHALRIRTVHDENARALRLIGGETDVAPSSFSPHLLPSLEARGLSVRARPGANLVYVLFRTDEGPFADVAHRKAFALALDRENLVRYLLDGRARLATGLLPPGHWAYTGTAGAGSEHADPAAARALLGGERLHCALLGSTDRLRVGIARVVAQQLAGVGIDADVVPLELGTLLARLSAGDFDAAILQIPELSEPNTLRVFLHSASIPPAGANRARVRDPEIDAALDAGDATLDLGARRAAYARLEARMAEQVYWVPLWYEDQVVVTSPRAKGFELSAEGRWLGLASIP
jgi:peptide/nickel transport system substrate-binding protein